MEVESSPSNYKKVGEILFAQCNEGKIGGRSVMQMTYKNIEINTPMDDGLFKMPAPEKPPEKK